MALGDPAGIFKFERTDTEYSCEPVRANDLQDTDGTQASCADEVHSRNA